MLRLETAQPVGDGVGSTSADSRDHAGAATSLIPTASPAQRSSGDVEVGATPCATRLLPVEQFRSDAPDDDIRGDDVQLGVARLR